jgi:hypothetical protein
LDVKDTRVKYHPACKAVARQKQLTKLNDRRREVECPHCHKQVVLVPKDKRRRTVAKVIDPDQITRDRIEAIQREIDERQEDIQNKQAEQQRLRDSLPKTEEEGGDAPQQSESDVSS